MLVRRDALARSRRHGGDPRRFDRRLRAGESAQGARSDLARADRARAQHSRLSGRGRYPPHGLAHRLCAASLFAAAPCRDRSRSGADLSRAGGARALRRRPGAKPRHRRVAADGVRFAADAAVLSACRRCGGWRCRRSPRSIWRSRSIPPISMRAGAAACGRAAPRPTSPAKLRNCDERCERRRRRGSGARARATGTRIFRWPPGSFIRAIARRSWRSTISCAPPTTSPTMRRWRRKRSFDLLDRLDAGLLGDNDERCRWPSVCAKRSPSAICRRGMRRICSPRSSSTSPSCATATGTI